MDIDKFLDTKTYDSLTTHLVWADRWAEKFERVVLPISFYMEQISSQLTAEGRTEEANLVISQHKAMVEFVFESGEIFDSLKRDIVNIIQDHQNSLREILNIIPEITRLYILDKQKEEQNK